LLKWNAREGLQIIAKGDPPMAERLKIKNEKR
jgi:hypothetical protein